MDEYRQKVIQAIADRNGDPLFNGSISHASVIFEELFLNAQSSIKILSGNLNSEVYGSGRFFNFLA